jgi:type II secretory pathway pseudopilin PulG
MIDPQPNRRFRRGITLVEVLLGTVLLATLALTGAAFLFHARVQVDAQLERRLALEAANGRLEQVRAAPYQQIRPLAWGYSTGYVTLGMVVQNNDPRESIALGGVPRPILTTVQYVDGSNRDGSNSCDYVRLAVSVGYHDGRDNCVTLETLYAP